MRRALLVLTVLLTVGITYSAGRQLGMATTMSTRHAYYSLPYAVSRDYFGTRGYMILREVAELFVHTHPRITNDTLAESITLTPARDRLMVFPGDDKGDADFAVIAFKVFGLHVESLYYLWFAMYLAGIAAFVAAYWRDASRLAALCLLTLAIYVSFFALPLTFELFSIHNPRAFGAVSLVPALHLMFALIDRQRFTVWHGLAAVVQAVLIAFSVNVRSTEWWQVLAIAGVAVWLLARHRAGIARLWPCAFLVLALVGLDVYQRASVDPVYEQSELRHRIFWHNVGIGFALNPVLAKKYALHIDDMPMIQLVRRRLVDTNRADQLDVVFRPAGQEDYQFSGFAKDFVLYEAEARDVVWSIVRDNKFDALKTFVYDKPRVFAMQIAWAMGYQGYTIDDLYLGGQIWGLVKEADRPTQSIYLNPFRPWALGGLLIVVFLGSIVERRGEYGQLCGVALWMCLMSLLPAMAAYPLIHAIAPVLATLPFLALACVIWLVAPVARRFVLQEPAVWGVGI